MSDPLNTLKACKEVAVPAKFVSINEDSLDPLAKKIIDTTDRYKKWSSGLAERIITGNLRDDIQFILIENAVNFCFWPDKDKPKWQVPWPKGNIVSGWNGLRACFERALAEKVPILNAEYLSSISEKNAQNFFRGTGAEIPLLKERAENLQETGMVLLEKFDGQFLNVVEESNFDAINLVELLTDNFSSFRDISYLDEKEIPFLKRAQITPNDIVYVLKDKNKKLERLDELTAFADYKLPQVLRMFGIIEYAQELAQKIDALVEIPHDIREEIEIRAATVWAIELLRQKIGNLSANVIDNIIWLLSQEIQAESKPYHRTRTIYY